MKLSRFAAALLALLLGAQALAYPPASPGLVLPSAIPLHAVVLDGSTPATQTQQAQEIDIPAGSSAQLNFAVSNAAGAAVDLSNATQVLLTVKLKASTSTTPLISRQATIPSPISGVGYFPLAIADTLSLRGLYAYEVTITWADGSRNQVVPLSAWMVLTALSTPAQPVTVPAVQTPLAIGPPGLKWRGSWVSTVAYAVNDAVQYLDVNGGLPALASSFLCLIANTNVPPLDAGGALSSSWVYLSQRGANGAGDGGAYTPANPAQWSPVPTTQQNAINQLATVLSRDVLDGAPIPVAGPYFWANPQPVTTSAQLDRLAAVVYAVVLDASPIPAAGSFSWASPTPILVADQVARLAYIVYVYALGSTPIP